MHSQCEPDGELGVLALKREFGADAFPRLGPVRSTAFKCRSCGLRFPVPGVGSDARGQASAWWRTKHPLCVRGEDPVRRGACARRGTRSPARRVGHAAASAHSIATAAAHTMSKKHSSFIMILRVSPCAAHNNRRADQERDFAAAGRTRSHTHRQRSATHTSGRNGGPSQRAMRVNRDGSLQAERAGRARAPTRARRCAATPRAATAARDRPQPHQGLGTARRGGQRFHWR